MDENYRRRWAVVAGVRDYGDAPLTRLASLDNAVNDACRIYRVLTRQYGFTARLLAKPEDVDAADQLLLPGQPELRREVAGSGTRQDILDAFNWILREEARPSDLFVFFFSGHGSKEDMGYLIPYGATEGRHASYLMYEALWPALSTLPCRHKLLLFDCCFAGLAAKGVEVPTQDANSSETRVANARNVVLCATDAYEVATDNYTNSVRHGEKSRHSPFLEALASHLEQARPGEAFTTRQLFDHVREQVTQVLLPSSFKDPVTGKDITIAPTYWPPDGTFISLRKPGIKIQVSLLGENSPLIVQTGATVRFPLTPQGGQAPYVWALETMQKGIRLAGNVLILDGSVLEAGSYCVTVRVTDCQQLFGQRAFSVEVLTPPQVAQPLTLVPPRLAPCFVGLPYQFKLGARGGVPPLEWEVVNLPEGLVCDLFHGTISGVVSRSAAQQCERMLRITVTDQSQSSAAVSRVMRLPVIDLDRYCEVPAGSFPIGYHETPTRTRELNRLSFREQVERRNVAGFPTGEVYLPRFFIKRLPVTNRDWKEFVERTNYAAQPRRWAAEDFNLEREGDLPITDIAYKDMLAYCAWRGSCLPSGWEWEKAARGGDGRLFPWGDEFDANLCNGRELNWCAPTPADQFPEGASACAALDMAGNAWECVRQFQDAYGQWRPVLRGGSFADETIDFLSCSGRLAPNEWHFHLEEGDVQLKPASPAVDAHIGFRDVIEVEDAPAYPQGFVPLLASHFILPGTNTEVNTPPVLLARYAVSNEEYREFILDTRRTRPPHWHQQDDKMFLFADRYLPVTNITFADAEAFCRWKSAQIRAECKLMTHRVWRAAVHGPGLQAQGFVPRPFPWGDQDIPFRRNGRDLGWGGPMRVFELAEGRGSCGAYHLVGNVAQWVSPSQAVGGSWLRDCHSPADWVERIDAEEIQRRVDLGFRYFRSLLPGENPAAAV